MNPYPAHNSVILLDNACIYKGDDIQELVESFGKFTFMLLIFHKTDTSIVGCWIEFLPPYSLEYQLIELAFSPIKAYLRRKGLTPMIEDSKQYRELYKACEVITPEMTWSF
jgi:transposase